MDYLELALSYIFPSVCGFCDTINEEYLCQKCESEIKLLEVEKEKLKEIKNKNFDELVCMYKYKGIIRDILIRYKFSKRSYIYKTIVKIIIKNEKVCRNLKKYDIIIPVPIHRERRLLRGYDQSYLIARELGKLINVEVHRDILTKEANNKPQSTLSKKERIENVKDVYKIKNTRKNIQEKNIILLDDIYTTGSTVNECSKILKQNGAKHITVLTLAKD